MGELIITTRCFEEGGPRLRTGYIPPASGVQRGLIVFLNGHNDWIEKYDFLTGQLDLPADMGFLTWDHRGQGASEGERSHLRSYDEFALDLRAIIAAHGPSDKLFVLAHSMGALIALYALFKGFLLPRALVFSSPLLGLPNHPVPRCLYRPLSSALARTRFSSHAFGPFVHASFAHNRKTHCPKAYARNVSSLFLSHQPTFGWLDATFRAIDFVYAQTLAAAAICPTLLMSGSEEGIVDPAGFSRWQACARHLPDAVRHHLIQGARHELWNEEPTLRGEAIRMTNEFLRVQLAAAGFSGA